MYDINFKNIYKGQTVKNYKEMCKLLDQADYTHDGVAKKKQLEKWKEFIDYTRSGRTFYINEIKTDEEIVDLHKPKEFKEKKPMGRPLKYGEDIATILAATLTKPGYQTFQYYELYELLGIMNKHYCLRDYKQINADLLHETDVIAKQQMEFMRLEIHLRCIPLLQSSFSGMHNREWINWKKTIKIWDSNTKRYYYDDHIETRIRGIEHLHRYQQAKSKQPQFGWKSGYTEDMKANYKSLKEDIQEQLHIEKYERVWRIAPLPDLQRQRGRGTEQDVIAVRIQLNQKVQEYLLKSFQTALQNRTLFRMRNYTDIDQIQTPEFVDHIPEIIYFFTDLD